MFSKVNRWFDDLSEPYRFAIFFFVILLPLCVVQFFSVIAWLALAVALIVMRVWWLYIREKRSNEQVSKDEADKNLKRVVDAYKENEQRRREWYNKN